VSFEERDVGQGFHPRSDVVFEEPSARGVHVKLSLASLRLNDAMANDGHVRRIRTLTGRYGTAAAMRSARMPGKSCSSISDPRGNRTCK
jgi:hypothetical protein